MEKVKYKLNGKFVTAEELDAYFEQHGKSNDDWLSKPPMVSNTYTEHDPLISDGCGVLKSQVKEGRDMIRKHNIQGAAILDNGQVQFTSRRARKEWLSRRGLCDLEGGYSDG
jgi:hypothetical protein